MLPLPAGFPVPGAGQEPAVTQLRIAVFAGLAALAGCARLPGPMPVPPQYPLAAEPAHYLFFREPAADSGIVSGISRTIIDDWRWAGRRAAMRLAVDETQAVYFQAQVVIPNEFVRAGGRSIEVFVDGKRLGAIAADKPGYVLWREPVPAQWLARGKDIGVVLAADAGWFERGEPRAYILVSAGFTL
jgi:hypothetical protein